MKDFTLDDIRTIINNSLLLKSTGDDFIDLRYEHHKTKSSHYWPYYRTLYLLAQHLQPDVIVELGGWQGTAAAHFASGNPTSTVITVDHHGDPGDDQNKSLMEAAARRYPNLTYLQGWTWDLVSTVKTYGEIDILFIDSWHDYDHAMQDWNDYSPLLAKPSLVICDDIIGGYGPVISGMLDFWNELPEPKFLENRIHPGSNVGFIKHD